MLLRKLCNVHLKMEPAAHFSKPRTSPNAFTLQHYAGPVTYHTIGFVQKNRDAISPDHIAMLKTSPVGGVVCTCC